MSDGKVVVDYENISSLANDLASLGRQMVSVSKKLLRMTDSQKVKEAKVTLKTDPEMFSDEFIASVKKARKEFKEGKAIDYFEFRKTLDL